MARLLWWCSTNASLEFISVYLERGRAEDLPFLAARKWSLETQTMTSTLFRWRNPVTADGFSRLSFVPAVAQSLRKAIFIHRISTQQPNWPSTSFLPLPKTAWPGHVRPSRPVKAAAAVAKTRPEHLPHPQQLLWSGCYSKTRAASENRIIERSSADVCTHNDKASSQMGIRRR